jgi:iron complex transport system substrate-binding protein
MRAVREQRAVTVSRSEFLIPGPRTIDGIESLARWLHPVKASP